MDLREREKKKVRIPPGGVWMVVALDRRTLRERSWIGELPSGGLPFDRIFDILGLQIKLKKINSKTKIKEKES